MHRLLIFSILLTAVIPVSAKKEKQPEINLADWAIQEASKLPEEIGGVKIFRVNDTDADGKARVTGFVDIPGLDTTQGFVAALINVSDNIDRGVDEISIVDFENKRFVVSRQIPDGEGKNATVYRYDTAFQFTDGIMTFCSYDINIEFKEKGIIPRKLDIEKFKPATNERHKEIVEGFFLTNSRIIDGIVKYAIANHDIKISHWDDIKDGTVVKGMNEAEVKLIGGKPRSVNQSGNRLQWMYSNDFIVIFTDGIVTNVIQ